MGARLNLQSVQQTWVHNIVCRSRLTQFPYFLASISSFCEIVKHFQYCNFWLRFQSFGLAPEYNSSVCMFFMFFFCNFFLNYVFFLHFLNLILLTLSQFWSLKTNSGIFITYCEHICALPLNAVCKILRQPASWLNKEFQARPKPQLCKKSKSPKVGKIFALFQRRSSQWENIPNNLHPALFPVCVCD